MPRPLLSFSLALTTLVLGATFALAQAPADTKADEQKTQGVNKKDTVPPATGRNLSEQAGTTEPSSKVKGTSKQENAFVNGVLAVPGADADGNTAPAKFSARNAADDQISIAGYRLRHLTADQRRDIVRQLGPATEAATGVSNAYAILGAEVPDALAQQALAPMPEDLMARFPALRGTTFMRAGNKILVVDTDNSFVVGVLGG